MRSTLSPCLRGAPDRCAAFTTSDSRCRPQTHASEVGRAPFGPLRVSRRTHKGRPFRSVLGAVWWCVHLPHRRIGRGTGVRVSCRFKPLAHEGVLMDRSCLNRESQARCAHCARGCARTGARATMLQEKRRTSKNHCSPKSSDTYQKKSSFYPLGSQKTIQP